MIDEIEKSMVNAFKLGMLDALGGAGKPDPIPALKEQGQNIKTAIYEIGLEVIESVDFKVKPHIENAAIFNMMVDEKLDELRKAWAKACGVEI